jgi:large subunit ribosomal protein L1
MARGKKYQKAIKKRPVEILSLKEAIEKVKELSYTKFPGSVELHANVKLAKDTDPKSIKGSVSFPNSVGTTDVKIAVFAEGEEAKNATKAGADIVGLEDLVKDIQKGKIEFDIAIATPSAMPKIAMLGKELGPRGLMPNPKLGTVTENVASAVAEFKAGKMNFKADAQGNIHMSVGKTDMDTEMIEENVKAAFKAIGEAFNKNVNTLLRQSHLSPTMGSSVKFRYEVE